MTQTNLGGTFTFANTPMTVNRMGYGAMQLAGPQVWGPPRDPEEAVRVLREAIQAGANWLVIGRPIYAAENPREAAEKIFESLS